MASWQATPALPPQTMRDQASSRRLPAQPGLHIEGQITETATASPCRPVPSHMMPIVLVIAGKNADRLLIPQLSSWGLWVISLDPEVLNQHPQPYSPHGASTDLIGHSLPNMSPSASKTGEGPPGLR